MAAVRRRFFRTRMQGELTDSFRMIDLDIKSGAVSVGGDGSAKMSFISRPDVARFVALALTRFPFEQLQDQTMRIEAERLSFNEVFEAYEAKSGKKLVVSYVPVDDLKARLAADGRDISAMIHLAWAEGMGVVGDQLDNGKWPEWKPSKVIDYL
jgi:nucleoside-diphosphate-sugar epimerase